MFDQLVVSSRQRRRHTTGKFFLLTSALYVFAIAGAFVVSVLAYDPKLADVNEITIIRLPVAKFEPPRTNVERGPRSDDTPPPDFRNVARLENLSRDRAVTPPIIDRGIFDPGSSGGPGGPG